MSDYIDRQLAIEVCDWHEHEFPECEYAIRLVSDDMKKLPSADVEPVRHGRWIYGTDDETGEQDIVAWTCSLCGEKTPWQPRYCMHCGARMDGEHESR